MWAQSRLESSVAEITALIERTVRTGSINPCPQETCILDKEGRPPPTPRMQADIG